MVVAVSDALKLELYAFLKIENCCFVLKRPLRHVECTELSVKTELPVSTDHLGKMVLLACAWRDITWEFVNTVGIV